MNLKRLKIQRVLKKLRIRHKSKKIDLNRVARIASASVISGITLPTNAATMPNHLDLNNQCYTFQSSVLDNAIIDNFYQLKLKSFKIVHPSQNISMSTKDFQELMFSHGTYVNDMVEMTGRSPEQIMWDMANYLDQRKIFIQPTGVSGIVHRITNFGYLTGATVQSAVATMTAHVSGTTGLTFIATTPGLVIMIPLVGGVFFGALERVGANTPLAPALIIARDVCLIPPKIAEIAYNELFVGPMLRRIGIDAPLNITSMLRFGNGTKVIFGSAMNATIGGIKDALYNQLY